MSTAETVRSSDRDQALRAIVEATSAAIADDPDKAHARFGATGAGGDGLRTEIRIGGHTVLVDEPPALGGDGAAPNPVENALAGLLSCQVVTYRFWAAKLGIPLDGVRIDVEGDLDVRGFFGLDSAVRPGFAEVRLRVTLDGPAARERYRELAAAVDQHCPVLDLFRNATPVSTRLVTGEAG
ncbi:OsmC family protein [Pseudonocardia acidicola]|uniref:OsmC family protein n=1 Tax=Pseudonocardia acidicola TaxID=2724939 RepID=A0ABX1SHX2_9PSEU|nr:OsmC family protein [Pseudonocardia acidicola]NMI01185.1 OsmC family protein [Pseudonocardia acidicola]